MKIKNERPPNYDKIVAAGLNPGPHTIFTYGDIIYVPSGQELPNHLIEHEGVHCDQQGDDPDAWWARYMADPYFRIEQEVSAYAKQYKFVCIRQKDRNKRVRFLMALASDLSSPIYGSVISQNKAFEMIKNKSGVH